MYTCKNCGKRIEELGKFVTCPHCGHKILKKERPPVVKAMGTD